MMQRLKQIKLKVTQFFPTELPITTEGLDRLTDQILFLGNLPDNPDSRATVLTAVMHLGPTASHKPTRYFVKSIRKALINKIAFEKMRAIQEKHQKDLNAHDESTGLQETSRQLVQEA